MVMESGGMWRNVGVLWIVAKSCRLCRNIACNGKWWNLSECSGMCWIVLERGGKVGSVLYSSGKLRKVLWEVL